MIEVMFAIRKDGFKDHPVIQEGLDLVDEEDQFTHMLPLEDEYDAEDLLSKASVKRRDLCWLYNNVCEFSDVCDVCAFVRCV